MAVVTEVCGVLVHVLYPCQCPVECSVSLQPQPGWFRDAISVFFMAYRWLMVMTGTLGNQEWCSFWTTLRFMDLMVHVSFCS